MRNVSLVVTGILLNVAAVHLAAQTSAPPVERADYLTLARGAMPVAVGGVGAGLGMSLERSLRAVDGDPTGFDLTLRPGSPTTDFELTYQLPAPTVFDRFAVPNVLETPSPGETFVRDIEIHGSATGPAGGFVQLASATLSVHRSRGAVTEIQPSARPAVRWIKVRLAGGLDTPRNTMFFEFSEIIGNGSQEVVPLAERFSGVWRGRGVALQMRQTGAVVTGCYDTDGELNGTVTGNVVRAVGVDRSDRVPSAFVLLVRDDGSLFGVRSANRAPFAIYAGESAPASTAPRCPPPAQAALGCGSVIHGINFDFDSAVIRAESAPVLAALFDGLKSHASQAMTIEGHTSNEGTEAYNQQLSERRAGAVRDDLVKRGMAASRLAAVGIGERRPIATNNDENGRSLNRRVEIHCR